MSDYTQIVNFTAKDGLTTGDPNKIIKGSEFDAEFSAIATAVSTKEDAVEKNTANGYCPLDASILVPLNNIPTTLTGKTAENATQLNSQAASYYLDSTNLTGTISDAVHGDRTGGSVHLAATAAFNGFMSSADKSKLDALDPVPAGVSNFDTGQFTSVYSNSNYTTLATALTVSSLTQSVPNVINSAAWSALSVVPAEAKAIIVRVASRVIGSTNGDLYQQEVHASATGDPDFSTLNNAVTYIQFINRSGASERAYQMNTAIIPITQSGGAQFNINWSDSGTSPVSQVFMYLQGWIE